MKIFFLLCLFGLVCALPARQSPFYERFKNFPLFEVDDNGSSEEDGLFEVEERSFGGRRNQPQGLDLERFKNIPLVFIDEDDEQPTSRNAPKQHKNVKMPLFYYSEPKPNSRRASNRFRNVPLIFLNEEPDTYDDIAYDDDDLVEVELHYDDEIVPPVPKKPVQVIRPSKRPQHNHKPKPKPNRPNRPNRPQKPKPVQKPVAKPVVKPTNPPTEKPVTEPQFEIVEGPLPVVEEVAVPEPVVQISEAPAPTVSTRIASENTIEVLKGNEKIEIPIPKSLEIVAFITKDGSIYEIDNGDENLLLVGKDVEKTENLKTIMEKSIQHTINKVFVDKDGVESGRSEAVIEVVPEEISKVVEDLTNLTKEEVEVKKEVVVEDKPVEEMEEVILTTPIPVDRNEFPLLRNANVDTISTY